MSGSTAAGGGTALHSSALVREVNRNQVVRVLRENGPMSKAELVRATGLTRPVVMAIVTSLLDSGILLESGTAPARDVAMPRGGRPGSLIRFNDAATTVVSARLIAGGLFVWQATTDGAAIAQRFVPAPADPGRVLDLVVRETRRVCGGPRSLGALSFTLPGFISQTHGTVTNPDFGWDRVPVRGPLGARLGVPVVLLSRAAAAVVGEVTSGCAVDHRNVILIFLARGIGAGIVADGRLLSGTGGAVGELGHWPVGGDATCSCGKRGCLETIASGSAIRAQATHRPGGQAPASMSLLDLAGLGEPRVDQAIGRAAQALGSAAAGVINLLDPSMVVLADTHFTHGAEFFFDMFKAAAEAHTVDNAEPAIVFGTHEAQARGAAHAATELLPPPLRPRHLLLPGSGA